jgi:Na+/phosphate symporter
MGLLCMFGLDALAQGFHSSYRLDVFSLLLFYVLLHTIVGGIILGALPWLKQQSWWAMPPAQGISELGIHHRYAVYPALALTYAKMHVTAMAQIAYSMLGQIMACFTEQAGQTIVWMDEQYDRMENRCRQMKFFLSRLNLEELSYRQTHLQSEFSQMNQTIKNLSSYINRDVVELATHKKERGMEFSAASMKSLSQYHQAIMENMLRTLDHLQTHNPQQAKAVTRNQKVLYSMGLELRQNHLEEIKDEKTPDLAASSLYFALVAHLQVLSITISKLAYPSLDRRKDRTQ